MQTNVSPAERQRFSFILLFTVLFTLILLHMILFRSTTLNIYYLNSHVSINTTVLNPKTPFCHSFDNDYEIEFRQSSTSRQVRFCPIDGQCPLIDWRTETERLNGVTLYLLGNSHLRNVFRCLSQLITSRETTDLDSICSASNVSRPTHFMRRDQTLAHCYSCNNSASLHNFDYYYNYTGDKAFQMTIHTYWTVMWTYDSSNNSKCANANQTSDYYSLLDDPARQWAWNNSRFPRNNLLRQLQLDGVKLNYNDPAEASEYERCLADKKKIDLKYSGGRVGLRMFQQTILPLLKDKQAFMVFNVYTEHETLYRLIEYAKQYPELKRKIVLIVDITAGDSFSRPLNDWKKAEMLFLDFRRVAAQYAQQRMNDASGPGYEDGHLRQPLQQLLIHHLMTMIVHQLWLNSDTRSQTNIPSIIRGCRKIS